MSGIGRRGVLKFLGLSSVAAPALAKAGIETGANAGSFVDYPMEYEELDESVRAIARSEWTPPAIEKYEDYRKHVSKGISPLDLARRIYRAEQERAFCTSDNYLKRRYMEERRSVTRLDPDLAAMKSFSAVALVEMQTKRNVARAKEHSAAYWDDVIDHLKKGFMTMRDVDKAMGMPNDDEMPSPARIPR